MKRIFFALAAVSTLLLAVAFLLGLNIGDPKTATEGVRSALRYHFLTSLAGLCFAALVHAIVLTYLVGTGRWIEEVGQAYRFEETWKRESAAMKWRIVPGIVGCFLLLLITGAFGAAVDPGAAVNFEGWAGFGGVTIHFLAAAITLVVNLMMYLREYQVIEKNNRLIHALLEEVKRKREQGKRKMENGKWKK